MNPGRTGIPQGKMNWEKGYLRNTTNQQRKRKSSRHKYSGQRKVTRHRWSKSGRGRHSQLEGKGQLEEVQSKSDTREENLQNKHDITRSSEGNKQEKKLEIQIQTGNDTRNHDKISGSFFFCFTSKKKRVCYLSLVPNFPLLRWFHLKIKTNWFNISEKNLLQKNPQNWCKASFLRHETLFVH